MTSRSFWQAMFAGCGALACLLGSAFGQATPRTIAVSEVRAGMRGYGLTVMRGETPERFDVEVIDVLHGFRPGQDIVLIRTDHPILANTASVAGMSGSPIYLEGRLLGAYAYGWPFGKDPIAGVTPIANMLADSTRTTARPIPGVLPAAPASATAPQHAARNHAWLGRTRTTALSGMAQFHAQQRAQESAMALDLRPAASPLFVGGVGRAAISVLEEAFAPLGMVPLQGGTGGAAPNAQRPQFVDGGAIAVTLTRGDVATNAVGTVTLVDGRRVLAFGHPMLNAGEITLPTATARVLHVLASTQRSFKIAEAVAPLGALTQDRQSTIVIDTAAAPRMIPMRVRIEGVPNAPKTEWNVEIANHRLLTPALAASVLAGIVEATASDIADLTLDVATHARVVNHRAVDLEDHIVTRSGMSDPRALMRLRLFSLLDAIYSNPFEDAEPDSLDLTLRFRFNDLGARIIDASVTSDEIDPGEDARVLLTLRRYGQPDQTRSITVPITANCAGSEVEIAFLPGDEVAVEDPLPRDLNDLLDAFGRDLPGNTLIAQVRLPSRGLRFENHLASELPSAAVDALIATNGSGPVAAFTPYARTRFDFNETITGAARVRLRVRQARR